MNLVIRKCIMRISFFFEDMLELKGTLCGNPPTFDKRHLSEDLVVPLVLWNIAHIFNTKTGKTPIHFEILQHGGGQQTPVAIGHFCVWQRMMTKLYTGWWASQGGVNKDRLIAAFKPYCYKLQPSDLNMLCCRTGTAPMANQRRTAEHGVFVMDIQWVGLAVRELYDMSLEDVFAFASCAEFPDIASLKQCKSLSAYMLVHIGQSKLVPVEKAHMYSVFDSYTPFMGLPWDRKKLEYLQQHFSAWFPAAVPISERNQVKHWDSLFHYSEDVVETEVPRVTMDDRHLCVATDSNYNRRKRSRQVQAWAHEYGLMTNHVLTKEKRKELDGKTDEVRDLDRTAMEFVLNSPQDEDLNYSEADQVYVNKLNPLIALVLATAKTGG